MRKKVHTRNRQAPQCERRRSSTRIQSTGDDRYVNQHGCVMAWSEKHRAYVPTGEVAMPPAVNSPRP